MTTPANEEKGVAYSIKQERRRGARAKIAPNEILYMNLQSGNGGVVLDVSHRGLGFQAATPVVAAESLSFRFAAPAIEHIEISGQVMWLDETRKRGGMQLSYLPVEVRKEIQMWLRRHLPPTSSVGPSEEVIDNPASQNANAVQSGATLEASGATDSAHSLSSLREPRVVKPLSQVHANTPAPATRFASVLGPDLHASGPKPGPEERPASSPERIPSPQWDYAALSAPGESGWTRHLFTASFIVALVLVILAVGFFYFGNRRRAGEWLIRLGESISGEQWKQSVEVPAAAGSESPTMAVHPTDSAAPNPSEGNEQNSSVAAEQPSADATQARQAGIDQSHAGSGASDTVADASTHMSEERHSAQAEAKNTSESAENRTTKSAHGDNGEEELARAETYLQGTGRADSAMAAQLLWEAVGKGNSDAEVELAGLYLRGEGAVPKNCEQARILLKAAKNNHNPGADQWLARLRDYGCR